MNDKAALILGVLLTLVLLASVGYLGLYVWATQSFSAPLLAVVSSPASAGDEVWLDDDRSEVTAFAYDFSTEQAVLPKWQSRYRMPRKALTEWRQHEKRIQELVQRHGGLGDAAFGLQDVRTSSRKVWFWQVPKR